MSFLSSALIVAASSLGPSPTMAIPVPSTRNKSVEYRPAIHFSPEVGFMNDPNGSIYDDVAQKYHMYFQLNPNDSIAGNQHWGHATSSDLYHWEDQQVAISPSADGGTAFSGSVVNDVNNTSGSFSNSSQQNFVAILTRAYPDHQEQVIKYSTDGGMTYQEYEHNPVLDLNLSQFRDPQVQWMEKYNKWVMVVASSREHYIRFYESKDLINWTKLSDFQSGIFGVDYECPNFVPVLDEQNNTRWVLFISINPGMPLGGSGTQYFVGDFNGTTFIPDQRQLNTQIVDFAKDNYALQYINPGSKSYNVSEKELASESTYIGWFGNWQYCQETPSDSWRSAMTTPRILSLRKDWLNVTRLAQQPRASESLRTDKPIKVPFNVSKGETSPILDLTLENVTAYEIIVQGTVAPFKSNSHPGSQRLHLDIFNDYKEYSQVGIDALSNGVWVDRGNMRGFRNPFFTDKFSAPLKQQTTDFEWRLVLDASLLEFFTEDGLTVASAAYFSEKPLTNVILRAPEAGSFSGNITVYPSEKTMPRDTLP